MAARYLLDTDTCVYIKREQPLKVRNRMARQPPGSVVISVITWGELMLGAMKSKQPALARQKLNELADVLPVLPLSPEAGELYGTIRAELERAGTPIGGNDLWIAAHAKAEGLILVSNNEREFKRVKGLKVENWAV